MDTPKSEILETLKHLEEQLQSAVGAKYEALARLDKIEGKEQTLGQKELLMEMEIEHLSSEIASLRDKFNRTIAETMALRQKLASTTVQYDIDLKRKTEGLRAANSTIHLLTDRNQSLTSQCEDFIQKLWYHMAATECLINSYTKELDVKIALIDLYKENSDDCQAHINETEAYVQEIQQMLNETTDQHQLELDEKDETINKLKQELEVANESFRLIISEIPFRESSVEHDQS